MAVYNEKDNSMLRQLQMYELNLLKTFAGICEKHHLKYYMIGGTMLGAIRHQGFIPWDDDVDIGMPREDYKKFMEIVETEIPSYMVFLNYKKDKEYLRYFSRLVDRRVEIYNDSNTDTLVENAWIDIFPLDGTPDNKLRRWLFFTRLSAVRTMYHFSCFEKMVNLMRPGRPLYQRIIIKIGQKTKLGRNMDSKKILDRLDRKLQKFSFEDSKYVMNFFGAYVYKEILPREWFGDHARYQFEDIMLSGPAQYDPYLKQFYGEYEIPPSDEHKDKHTITKIELKNEVE